MHGGAGCFLRMSEMCASQANLSVMLGLALVGLRKIAAVMYGGYRQKVVFEYPGHSGRFRPPKFGGGKSEVGIGGAHHSMISVDYGLTMTLMSDPEMLLMYE